MFQNIVIILGEFINVFIYIFLRHGEPLVHFDFCIKPYFIFLCSGFIQKYSGTELKKKS